MMNRFFRNTPRNALYSVVEQAKDMEHAQVFLALQNAFKRELQRACFAAVDGDIQKALPHLRMNPKKKAYWSHAIKIWS